MGPSSVPPPPSISPTKVADGDFTGGIESRTILIWDLIMHIPLHWVAQSFSFYEVCPLGEFPLYVYIISISSISRIIYDRDITLWVVLNRLCVLMYNNNIVPADDSYYWWNVWDECQWSLSGSGNIYGPPASVGSTMNNENVKPSSLQSKSKTNSGLPTHQQKMQQQTAHMKPQLIVHLQDSQVYMQAKM